MDAQGLQDLEKTCQFGLKIKGATKLDITELDRYDTYPEEEVLPQEGS